MVGESLANLLEPWPLKLVLDEVLRSRHSQTAVMGYIYGLIGADKVLLAVDDGYREFALADGKVVWHPLEVDPSNPLGVERDRPLPGGGSAGPSSEKGEGSR